MEAVFGSHSPTLLLFFICAAFVLGTLISAKGWRPFAWFVPTERESLGKVIASGSRRMSQICPNHDVGQTGSVLPDHSVHACDIILDDLPEAMCFWPCEMDAGFVKGARVNCCYVDSNVGPSLRSVTLVH